ncbi:MAG: malonate decarboxylase holo-ACP synthase [Janthinobacterium lividum]
MIHGDGADLTEGADRTDRASETSEANSTGASSGAAALPWDPPLQAHDLLRIDPLTHFHGAPAWVAAALARAPWVVVRRARDAPACVPIGVRGASRGERYGARLAPGQIIARVRPEALAGLLASRDGGARGGCVEREAGAARASDVMPALAMLPALRAVFAAADLRWGPTGSVGFELASGVPTATATSDLDLLVRCPQRLSRSAAHRLRDALAEVSRHHAGCRIDALLETPHGAVALTEYAAAAGPVLLRTTGAPRLSADPWSPDVTARPAAADSAAGSTHG